MPEQLPVDQEDITPEEITLFFASLGEEMKYFGVTQETILAESIYLVGLRVDGRLAAVGSLRPSFWGVPFTTYLVRADCHRCGLGTELNHRFVDYARSEKVPLLLATVNKANKAMLMLAFREGYRVCYNLHDNWWLYLPVDWKGRLLGRLLRPSIKCRIIRPLRWLFGLVRHY